MLGATYGKRRAAIRDTFLPALSTMPETEFKFVVGHSADIFVTASMAVEEARYPGSFMHLNMTVCPHSMVLC